MAGLRSPIGVLDLQGAVEPHLEHLRALTEPVEPRAVRRAVDFEGLSGLILPGGESTAMLRLLDLAGMTAELAAALAALPVWGVCAGAILLARRVHPQQRSFGALDASIERNAYGGQLDSFSALLCDYPVAFIRAPKIVQHGSGVRVRASYGGAPVWLEQGSIWATTFHPELSLPRPSPFHVEFAERCLALGRRGSAEGALSPR